MGGHGTARRCGARFSRDGTDIFGPSRSVEAVPYKSPRLGYAAAYPWSAARRYQCLATALCYGTLRPSKYLIPGSRDASAPSYEECDVAERPWRGRLGPFPAAGAATHLFTVRNLYPQGDAKLIIRNGEFRIGHLGTFLTETAEVSANGITGETWEVELAFADLLTGNAWLERSVLQTDAVLTRHPFRHVQLTGGPCGTTDPTQRCTWTNDWEIPKRTPSWATAPTTRTNALGCLCPFSGRAPLLWMQRTRGTNTTWAVFSVQGWRP